MNLEKLRNDIDKIDDEILSLISKRFSLVKKVAKYKLKNNLPIKDKRREKDIIDEKRWLAENFNINPDFVEKIYRLFIKESCDLQEKMRENKDEN